MLRRPRPSARRYQERASSAAGLVRGSGRRVTSSIPRAPSSRPSTSAPCRARGSSPTAEVTDVRPPTQSHSGKRASHPSRAASESRALPSHRRRDGVPGEGEPDTLEGSADLAEDVHRRRRPPGLGDHRDQRAVQLGTQPGQQCPAVRVGVVRRGHGRTSSGVASAPQISCGPSADPPMPMCRRVGKPLRRRRRRRGGRRRERATADCASRIAAAVLGRRCPLGRPEPVVTDHPVLVGVGDRALLERRHGGQSRRQSRRRPVEGPHPAEVDADAELGTSTRPAR